jgi:hypothetical protein
MGETRKRRRYRGTGSAAGQAYKEAVDEWIAAIRAEEDLATPDHSVPAVDVWEHAGFDEEEARDKAKEARQAMKTRSGRRIFFEGRVGAVSTGCRPLARP